jgi:C_GCAxxG_C_C family probable redox protein
MQKCDNRTALTDFIRMRVHDYFWKADLNCAGTTLMVMAEHFSVDIEQQVLDAASGMHGAGGYRAQCGIVEGSLMFIGILGKCHSISETEISSFCSNFAAHFEQDFGSLSCAILRPTGFRSDDPSHLCEPLTVRAVTFTIPLIETWLPTHLNPSRTCNQG